MKKTTISEKEERACFVHLEVTDTEELDESHTHRAKAEEIDNIFTYMRQGRGREESTTI